jgi:hypothetical protein
MRHARSPARARHSVREVADALAAWNGFYVMLGSAAAALTGLMFVVITLVTDRKRGTSEAGISTFSTPTVVHFSCALFTAASMTAPFPSFVPIAIVLGCAGAAGLVYQTRVAVLTSRLQAYRPDTEDIVWHLALPILAYAALVCGAIALPIAPSRALFAPAASAILFIFIGIHNAWDVVTFIAIDDDETSD